MILMTSHRNNTEVKRGRKQEKVDYLYERGSERIKGVYSMVFEIKQIFNTTDLLYKWSCTEAIVAGRTVDNYAPEWWKE